MHRMTLQREGALAAGLLAALLACNRTPAGKGDAAADGGGAAGDGPKTAVMQLPETSFDFGDVERGKDAAHTFVIKNISNKETLHIQRAQGS